MIIRKRIYHYKGNGNLSVYKDKFGSYVVAVSVDNQKSLYPKVFYSKETALKHAEWIEKNWDYHIVDFNRIKTTFRACL